MMVKVRWQRVAAQSPGQLKRVQHQTGCQLLTTLAKTEVAYHRLGQPYLPRYPQLGVSVSHSATLVVVVLAEQAVGVDVECQRSVDWTRYRRAFTAVEWAYLVQQADDQRADLAWGLWTAKEAVLKLQGRGLTRSPRRVQVALPEMTSAVDGQRRFQLSRLELPGHYVGTLAREV